MAYEFQWVFVTVIAASISGVGRLHCGCEVLPGKALNCNFKLCRLSSIQTLIFSVRPEESLKLLREVFVVTYDLVLLYHYKA